MDTERTLLLEAKIDIDNLLQTSNLIYLGKIIRSLNRYCILNQVDLNIKSEDIIKLSQMSIPNE